MLVQAFANDWSCIAFGEDGGLALGASAGHHKRWRWKSYQEVAKIMGQKHAPLLIAKPLVESQWAEELLSALPGAKIIWAYRNFADVILSGQEHFGSEAIQYNLKSIIDNRPHWYSENIADATRELVVKYFHPDRSVYDLRGLGWYVRNSLVLNYDHLPITFSKYENLVTSPAEEMRKLYHFLDYPYPGDQIVKHVHTSSLQRGKDVQLSEDIRKLCETMLAKLDVLNATTASNNQ